VISVGLADNMGDYITVIINFHFGQAVPLSCARFPFNVSTVQFNVFLMEERIFINVR